MVESASCLYASRCVVMKLMVSVSGTPPRSRVTLRTRPSRAIEEGGIGAFQVNLRYDRLDLNSGAIRGGTQNGFMASLVWIPTDHVRFLINYARLNYDDAVLAAAGGDRSYGVDVIGARAQIDF